MVVHIGIHPYSGKVAFFNTVTNQTSQFSLDYTVSRSEDEKISEMYEKIENYVNEKIGCICIFLEAFFKNKIRKKFIAVGENSGFSKIEIIDFTAYFYMMTVSQVRRKPHNGDVIWIFHKSKCFVWQKKNQKAKFIKFFFRLKDSDENIELLKIKSSLVNLEDPFLILSNVPLNQDIVKTLFPDVIVLTYIECMDYENYALMKAQIMADISNVMEYDVNPVFGQRLIVKIGETRSFSINKWDTLPLERSINVSNKEDINYIKIINDNGELDVQKAVLSENFTFLFKLDTNGIYTTSFIYANIDFLNTDYPDSALLQMLNLTKKIYSLPSKITENDALVNSVGIDLGTSRCCMAVNRKNGIETGPIENTGGRLLPSFASFDEMKEKCGQAVVNRLQNYAKYTVYDVKRIIGKPYKHIVSDPTWPFSIIEEDDKVYIKVECQNGPIKKLPEEVAAVFLKFMKEKAEEYQGKKFDKVVITIPTGFNENQMLATLKAAKIAGWKQVCFLFEPLAAAFVYFINNSLANNSSILTFDFGGGTLDVCIFKVSDNNIEIISNMGDTCLGGRDFDNALYNYLHGILEQRYNVTIKEREKYRLMEQCVKTKVNLSVYDEDLVDFENISLKTEGKINITRKKFEEITMPLLLNIKTLIIKTLQAAKYDFNQIDKVLLVGGSCRMPMIQRLLKETFPSSEQCCQENPDEVVAMGAAYYAYNLMKNKTN